MDTRQSRDQQGPSLRGYAGPPAAATDQAAISTTTSLLGQLAGGRSWDDVRQDAYERVRQQMGSKTRSAAAAAMDNIKQATEAAQEVVQAPSAPARISKMGALLRALDSGPLAAWLARALICSYYVNMAYAGWESYRVLQDHGARAGLRRWSTDPVATAPEFPYLLVCGVLPAALLTTAGVFPLGFGLLLLAKELTTDTWLTLLQLRAWLVYGSRPTELVVKQFAMAGATALVLAHSVKDNPRFRSSLPGLLLSGSEDTSESDRPRPGTGRSAVLLLGRLMLAALFVFVGVSQVRRIVARDYSLLMTPEQRRGQHWGVKDGHDNNWLLLETALAPFLAVGLAIGVVSRLLCGVLLLEALTCWPFWASYWPSWHYRSHVRLHFFVNLAAAGGLLLLQSFGAGRFTVDELIRAKKRQ